MIDFVYGSDTYRLRETIAARLTSSGAPVSSTIDLDAPGGRAQLEDALQRQSLFAEQRFIVVQNVLADPKFEKLAQQAEARERADVFLIAVQAFPDGKRSPSAQRGIEKLSAQAHTTTVCDPLAGIPLQRWLVQQCAAHGVTIEPAVARVLIERVGTDSWALATAVEKLCAYAETAVTEDAVYQLIPIAPEQQEWAFSNALAARQKRAAIAALHQRIAGGTSEQLLVGMLSSAVRTLMLVGDLAARGHSGAAIAQKTGLHPFVVSKNLRGAAAYPMAYLMHAHALLARMDRASKTGTADLTDELFGIVIGL